MKRAYLTLLAAIFASLTIAGATVPTVTKTLGQTAKISWTAPTSYTDGTAIPSGTVITYDVFENDCANNTYGSPAVTDITATSWTTPAYSATGSDCYVVVAVVHDVMSVPSQPVKVIVAFVPGCPIDVTVQ